MAISFTVPGHGREDGGVSWMALVVAVATSACAGNPGLPPEPAEDLLQHGAIDDRGRIHYVGSIEDSANAVVMERFEAADPRPRTLLVSSSGGGVRAGLALGEWVLEHGLEVEVADWCVSSCANYVFLAGSVKKLRRDSFVAWHGSAWQESFDRVADPESEVYAPDFVEFRKREVDFYDRLGVDHAITVYGQDHGPGVVSWRQFTNFVLRRGAMIGWDYSLDDLRRLGVENIRLVDGGWNWREHRPDVAPRVWRQSLEEDYEFTPRRFEADLPAPVEPSE